MHIQLPGPLKLWSVQVFAWIYSIDVEEAEKPLEEYRSIGDFFVRKLKPGRRPLALARMLHPADSRINAIGSIAKEKIYQVKSHPYSVEDILGNAKRAHDLEGGIFATYYLCPTDYHRVHAPVSGKIISVEHIPGRLWPVFQKSLELIPNLFANNERMIVNIDTEIGLVSVVFVGALNVGKIELAFDVEFYSQVFGLSQKRVRDYSPSIDIKAGEELGLFRMGSTVVVFYPRTYCSFVDEAKLTNFVDKKVQVGQALSL